MNKQENNEQEYQPSLFEKLLPLLGDWHLIELKIAQLKAKGGGLCEIGLGLFARYCLDNQS